MSHENEDVIREAMRTAVGEFTRIVDRLNYSQPQDLLAMLTLSDVSREVFRNKTLSGLTLTSDEANLLSGLGVDLRLCEFESAIPTGCWLSENSFLESLKEVGRGSTTFRITAPADRQFMRGYWGRNPNPEIGEELFLTDDHGLMISGSGLTYHVLHDTTGVLRPGKYYRIDDENLGFAYDGRLRDSLDIDVSEEPFHPLKRSYTDVYECNVNVPNGIESEPKNMAWMWKEMPLAEHGNPRTVRQKAKSLLKCGQSFVVLLGSDDVRIWNGEVRDPGHKILTERRVRWISPAGQDTFFAVVQPRGEAGDLATLLLVNHEGRVLDWAKWGMSRTSVPGALIATTYLSRHRVVRRLLFSFEGEIRGLSVDGKWMFVKEQDKIPIDPPGLSGRDYGRVSMVQVVSGGARIFVAFDGGAWLLLTASGGRVASGEFPVSFCEEDAFGRLLLLDGRIGLVALDAERGNILFAVRSSGMPVLQEGKFAYDGTIILCEAVEGFRTTQLATRDPSPEFLRLTLLAN